MGVLGCAVVAESEESTRTPDEGIAVEPADTVPEAVAVLPPDESFEAESAASCTELLGDAQGVVRADLLALCGADGHDGDCVGFVCERTAPREALECLLEAGEAPRVIALQHAEGPATRAFAREALTRNDAWTEDDLRRALHDDGVVQTCGGCLCSSESLRSTGLEQALRHPDRAMVQPVLAEWMAGDPEPFAVAEAIAERPTERWVSEARLLELVGDPKEDLHLRVSAAMALARRGDDAGRAVLEEGARAEHAPTRALAVRGWDALGDADAWDRWRSLRQDDDLGVRRAMLRLGAHLRPRAAAEILDRGGHDEVMVELPPRSFRTRAPRAICAHRYADEASKRGLVEALGGLLGAQRCQALRWAEDRCSSADEPAGSVLAATVPALAQECGIELPSAEPTFEERFSPCHRTRRRQEAEYERREKARALELERRARDAAAAE